MEEDLEFPLLAAQGLYAATTIGDGNCLFRALADQLYEDHERHGSVRHDVVEFLRRNKSKFIEFLPTEYATTNRAKNGKARGGRRKATTLQISRPETKTISSEKIEALWLAYLDQMATDGVYGDNLEIVACAQKFNVNIKIHLSHFAYVVSGQSSLQIESTIEQRRMLHIAYHEWEHYSSVRRLDGLAIGVSEISMDAEAYMTTVKDYKHFQPWMMKVISASLPDLDKERHTDHFILDLIEQYKGDVNRVVEHIYDRNYDDWETLDVKDVSEKMLQSDSTEPSVIIQAEDSTSRPAPSFTTTALSKVAQRRELARQRRQQKRATKHTSTEQEIQQKVDPLESNDLQPNAKKVVFI
ncbi:hypothetical protein V1512DRAFT_128602 [Lipomyces arxii]|uniref:uncharacterized protein n=1 Tax=Lipomyces arxii TaxID=56418 RepID=UPI0034CF6168